MEKKEIQLPDSQDWVSRMSQTARTNMKEYHSCTQSILAAFMEAVGLDEPWVMRSAGALHGGMLTSLTCGVHTAGMMILGLVMGRERIEEGLDGMMPVLMPAQELMDRLNKVVGGHSCLELTGVDFSDLNQAITFMGSDAYEKCLARVEDGAREIGLFLLNLNERGELFQAPGAPQG